VHRRPETRRACRRTSDRRGLAARPSVARGYWNAPEATAAVFRARRADQPDGSFWLRSGDLGFVRDGHLHVTGRRKDLIILRGENYYPQDLEWAVQGRHPALRPNAAVAFAADDGGPERVILACRGLHGAAR
jgi:acyl-CoA synthetase (AMP-forming)/AMP-acid ligase II